MTVTDTAPVLVKSALTAAQRANKPVTTVSGQFRFDGQLWQIRAVNVKNAILAPFGRPDAPNNECVNMPFGKIRLYEGDPAEFSPARAAATVTLEPYVAPLPEGTVVRISRPFQNFTTRDLFVVTGHGSRRVTLARLGGGRGLRAPQAGLRVVPLPEVATALAALHAGV